MSDMIERIARVLSARRNPTTESDVADWQAFIAEARAVLEALRDPTERMSLAGAEFFEEETAKQNKFAAAIVYGAMIKAALDNTDG